MATNSKWYSFRQNNSGGSFDEDESSGIGVFVIIEAESAGQANSRAESIGVYFDGVDGDIDCECCGDRWYSVSEVDGEDSPMIYGNPVGIDLDGGEFTYFGIRSFIHPLSGKFGVARVAE